VKLVKIVSIAVLLATAVLWSKVAEFETIVRFAVVIGAVMVIFQAFHARRYALVALFGAIALLYNPVVRAFSFTDEWQRGVVAASSLPFIGSLFWHDVRTT
jgi:uncharacterized membrane protein YoaK (UPF0700 family)